MDDAKRIDGQADSRASQPSEPSPRPAAGSFGRILRSLIRKPSRFNPIEAARAVGVLCRALCSERGEASGARLAAEVLQAYESLDQAGREAFFDLLVTDFSPDPAQIGRAAGVYAADNSQANLVRLQAAIESPRRELFRRFNLSPNGTAVLVGLRRQLLKTLAAHPERAGVDADLLHLFRSWFSRGFLFLQRIDWRTSALVLERLIEYEAVHQIQGWRDLRRRLDVDRRCYGFFHPALPDQPLIFIEVALTRGMPAKVQPLLDPDAPVSDPMKADCAVFYSITNCQEGLRGVSFGNFLIKQVVDELRGGFPGLKTFATLSPVSGFGAWVADGTYALSVADRPGAVRKIVERLRLGKWSGRESGLGIRGELYRLCAFYLVHAADGKGPLDSVARFHLANGARLERLNWMGDTSASGLSRSLGFTANYVYELADVERNHEAYAKTFAVAASREITRLAMRGRRAHESQEHHASGK